MLKFYIVGRDYMAEHLCKYFKEKYIHDEVTYFTDSLNFEIINSKDYTIKDLNQLDFSNPIDYFINLIDEASFLEQIQKLNIKHLHQILWNRDSSLEEMLNAFPFKVTMSYSPCVFGPGQSLEEPIPFWITAAMDNRTIELKTNYERNWVFVADFCEAVDIILQKGNTNVVYNISSAFKTKDTEVIKMICRNLNKSRLLSLQVDDIINQTLEYKELQNLGWKPKRSLDKALFLTSNWYLLDKLGEQLKDVIKESTKK